MSPPPEAAGSVAGKLEMEAYLLIPGDRFRRNGTLWRVTRVAHTPGEPLAVEAETIVAGKPPEPGTMAIEPTEILRLG